MTEALLKVENLKVYFPVKGGIMLRARALRVSSSVGWSLGMRVAL